MGVSSVTYYASPQNRCVIHVNHHRQTFAVLGYCSERSERKTLAIQSKLNNKIGFKGRVEDKKKWHFSPSSTSRRTGDPKAEGLSTNSLL